MSARKLFFFATLVLAIATPRRANAESNESPTFRFSGLANLGTENQIDWNSLIDDYNSSVGGAGGRFDDQYRFSYGAQIDFHSDLFGSRFLIGAQYAYLAESSSGTKTASSSGAHFIQLVDTFYLMPLSSPINVGFQVGGGYLRASGTHRADTSSFSFKGQYFLVSAGVSLELRWEWLTLGIEGGYRYAVVPRVQVTSASGPLYGSLAAGDTVYIVKSGQSKKFTLNYSGVFYGVVLRVSL